jgi:hypothetical protein
VKEESQLTLRGFLGTHVVPLEEETEVKVRLEEDEEGKE